MGGTHERYWNHQATLSNGYVRGPYEIRCFVAFSRGPQTTAREINEIS